MLNLDKYTLTYYGTLACEGMAHYRSSDWRELYFNKDMMFGEGWNIHAVNHQYCTPWT